MKSSKSETEGSAEKDVKLGISKLQIRPARSRRTKLPMMCRICNISFASVWTLCNHNKKCHNWWRKKRVLTEEEEEAMSMCVARKPELEIVKGKYICSGCVGIFPTVDTFSSHQSRCPGYETEDEDEIEVKFDEDRKEPWVEDEAFASDCLLFAERCMRYLNTQVGGKRYGLVEPGPAVAENRCSVFFHVNFKAKEIDCPNAEVETFFGQVRVQPHTVVQCCVSLGPSHKLPHWTKPNLGGCTYCFGWVNHPTGKVDGLKLVPAKLNAEGYYEREG